MILFVGSEESGYFAEEEAKVSHMDFSYINENIHIEKHAEEILNYENCQYIIYDIEQYLDDSSVIIEWILKIQSATNTKTIIYSPGYNPRSEIISGLYNAGIKNYIFSSFLSEKKEDMERCINGFYENYGYESRGISFDDVPDNEEIEKEKQKIISKSIGVAGAISRMGTTTQCIQLCKYILYMGYKPAYIQLNNHGWIENLLEAYADVKHDAEMGKVEYLDVDMFYKIDKIPEVLQRDYDFFIYDYGVYSDPSFSKISFLEKERQIFVVGSKPGEFDRTYNVIKSNFFNKVYYIFNFVPETEEKDLLELMENKAEYTFFSPEIRDPFTYSNSKIYQELLPIKCQNNEEKKKFFFGKKRKKEVRGHE